jgi:hypothetical protein
MAVRQAVQRAPHYPESHNINGLVSEVRSDFQSAIASYRQAKFALDMMRNSKTDCRCHIADISVNLARSLCKVRVLSSALMTTKKKIHIRQLKDHVTSNVLCAISLHFLSHYLQMFMEQLSFNRCFDCRLVLQLRQCGSAKN